MKPKRPGVLPVALGVSVALHAAVLAVHFADPPATARRFDDAPLEVVLVNARPRDATDPSERPEALAQHTLAGGGTAAERGRLSEADRVLRKGDTSLQDIATELRKLDNRQADAGGSVPTYEPSRT